MSFPFKVASWKCVCYFYLHPFDKNIVTWLKDPRVAPAEGVQWEGGSSTPLVSRDNGALEIKVRSPASLRRKQPLPPPRVNSVISRNINLLDFPQQLGIS